MTTPDGPHDESKLSNDVNETFSVDVRKGIMTRNPVSNCDAIGVWLAWFALFIEAR